MIRMIRMILGDGNFGAGLKMGWIPVSVHSIRKVQESCWKPSLSPSLLLLPKLIQAAMASGASLSAVDVVIVTASLIGVLGVGFYGSKKAKNAAKNASDSFFLAGRAMPWWICAASLFASNIGTEHFVGQAGSAASSGIGVGLYEWSAVYFLAMLGWIFAPVYLKCQLKTVPEYLEGRYNKYCRIIFVVIIMMAYVLSKIGSSMYAGVVLFEVVTGLNMWVSAPLIIFSTAVYTAVGGLTVVMLTDTVQMMIFLFGGLLGTGVSLRLVGGISGLFKILKEKDLEYMTHMVRSVRDRDYPWPGMLLGLPNASILYWCIDQEMAQRVLSARSLDDAQLGAGFAALLKIVPVFITVIPGMVARALFEQCDPTAESNKWCRDPTEALNDDHSADKAYPFLVLREFPTGVKGIMVASFIAAMMSSLSSVYNSASTVFTYDVYERFRYPQGGAPPKRLVMVGRITTVLLTGLTFLWLPVLDGNNNGLYLAAQSALTHLSPPIVSIFLLGLFWRRANGPGATAGFLSGAVFGVVRWAVQLASEDICDKHVTESSAGKLMHLSGSTWFQCLNFNYFGIILFFFTSFVVIAVSLMTPPPSEAQIQGRMFGNLANVAKMIKLPSSPGGSENGAENRVAHDDHGVSERVPYNPFADTEGDSERDATRNNMYEFEIDGSNVQQPDANGSNLEPMYPQPAWIESYGRIVSKVFILTAMLSIAGLIIYFR